MGDLDLAGVLSPTDLGFSLGPVDLVSTVVGGRVMLYALSRGDKTITSIELTSAGWMVSGSLALTGSWTIGQMPHLTVTGAGLFVGGLDGDAMVSLGGTGQLLGQTASGALQQPSMVAEIAPGLLVSRKSDGSGLDIFSMAGGLPAWSGEIADTSETYLAGVSDIASFAHAGNRYLVAASSPEDGITLLRMEPDDTLSVAAVLGVLQGLPINDPAALAVSDGGPTAHVLLASRASNSVSVTSLTPEGEFVVSDHILDTQDHFFAGAAQIAVTHHGAFTFVAVAGSEGGVTLLALLANGRLQHIDSLADHMSTTLYRPSALTLSVIGDVLHLSVSSEWDSGITRLTVDLSTFGDVIEAPLGGAALSGTAGDDHILGSDVADTLDGGAGDDILFDGSGSDILKGGLGADLFVFAADGLPDTVLGFEVGIDRLDLSSWAFLHDIGQLEITSTASGAILTFGDETISLLTSDGSALPPGVLSTSDIIDLDRPIISAAGQNLKGGEADDTIIGGSSGDTIQGGGGGDQISGAPGDDMLMGQDGSDTMVGGNGADSLMGDAGDDAIRGDLGDDWISGGAGGDLLLGDGAEDWSGAFDWGGV